MKDKNMSPRELNDSAIAGLMALGRTREEAIREMQEAEQRHMDAADREFWDYDPGRDR
jgi:hypothetical protein